jgi:hypothetical protein
LEENFLSRLGSSATIRANFAETEITHNSEVGCGLAIHLKEKTL